MRDEPGFFISRLMATRRDLNRNRQARF
jgi:hypothetical protein